MGEVNGITFEIFMHRLTGGGWMDPKEMIRRKAKGRTRGRGKEEGEGRDEGNDRVGKMESIILQVFSILAAIDWNGQEGRNSRKVDEEEKEEKGSKIKSLLGDGRQSAMMILSTRHTLSGKQNR